VNSYATDGGQYLGAFINDVGALYEAQEKLRNSEQMLRSIAENLPTLIGQVDRQGRFVYLNSRALNFYGRPAGQMLGQTMRSACSEADYAKIEGYVDTAAGGRHVSFESDIVIDKRQFHYHAAFVPQRDAHGNPDGFFAMAFDITARRQSEIAQRDSEERLRTITDNVPVLISYLDSDLRYQFANAMYKDWLGVESTQMIGRTVIEVFGRDYYDERAHSIARAMSGHMSSVEVEVVRKGHERILNTTYMPHHRDGRVAGVYVLATDATAARVHERKLLALANADPLTNLPNRRMYEFHLAKALALSKRQNTRLALMYLDLDNFKRINDTHGHGAGDAVLVEFGKRVGATLRETDLLARLAGDEFTVVLEAVDSLENCQTIAHKIQQALHQPYHFDGRSLQIAASIGIALADSEATIATLSSQADQALYMAKRKGKNRFAIVEDGAEPLLP
jgi:diguanylate cyclase (GGDEF)-like protein/PAS domain S-box-containing protein